MTGGAAGREERAGITRVRSQERGQLIPGRVGMLLEAIQDLCDCCAHR